MKLNSIIADKSNNLKGIMKKLDIMGYGILFITENNKLIGSVTDGDIRSAILKGHTVEDNIVDIINKKPIFLRRGWNKLTIENILNKKNVRKKLPERGVLAIPIIDEEDKIIDVIFISEKGYQGKLEDGYKENNIIKNILIIGGAGYLGSVLSKILLDAGYKVKVLDNLTYGRSGIEKIENNPNFKFILGDIRNLKDLIEATKSVDAVIHLAAIVGDEASSLNPEETIEINYLASKMIAEICKYSQINRFIFASTCSVYGASKHNRLLDEKSELNPVSLYARMKLESEKGILELSDENFSPIILRMGTLYGLSDRMRFDLVINLLSIKGCIDKEITIYGGNQYRGFCHVKDAALIYKKCIEAPINVIKGKTYNISSESEDIRTIGEKIKSIIPDCDIRTKEDMLDKRDYIINSLKLMKELGIRYKYSIDDGIKEIIEVSEEYSKYKDKIYNNYKQLKEGLYA